MSKSRSDEDVVIVLPKIESKIPSQKGQVEMHLATSLMAVRKYTSYYYKGLLIDNATCTAYAIYPGIIRPINLTFCSATVSSLV